MSESIVYICDECPHVFSFEDIMQERDDESWGHPCFEGAERCESYRACYRRTKSPITEDSFVEEKP